VVSLASEWGILIFGYFGSVKKFRRSLGTYGGFTPTSSLPSRRVSGVSVHMNIMRRLRRAAQFWMSFREGAPPLISELKAYQL